MVAKHRDLLSDLPDEILHHIFSFLKVKDILKLRILSRSFHKTLCASIPSFCFSRDPDPYKCSCKHVFNFMKNTVPQNRPHALMINRIALSCFCFKNKHANLHKQWIVRLFETFHVDELSFDCNLPSIFKSLPKFQSLKVLKLNMNLSARSMSEFPKMELASLETLHIKSIYADSPLDEWISESFPSLKHLSLRKVSDWTEKQEFTIRSSSLEDLTFHDFNCFKPVRIIAENLRTLTCFIPESLLPRTTTLVLGTCEANLHSLTWIGCGDEETFQNLQVTTNPRALITGESNLSVLRQLFKAIRSARELHIDTEVLQNWVRMPRTPMGMLEDSLKNLSHLDIDIQWWTNDGDYIAILERLPNLESLTLGNHPTFISNPNYPHLEEEQSVEDCFKKALRECRRHASRRTKGLKKVKLIVRDFNHDMVIVIGRLMKSCTDLEEMMLYYPSCFHKSMMEDGVLYLQGFERASHTPPSFHFFPQNRIP